LFQRAKIFAKWMWENKKEIYFHTKKAFQLRRRTSVIDRADYRFLRQNWMDIKKAVPILLIKKLIPFSALWVPFVILKYPGLLPSTFNIDELKKQILSKEKLENVEKKVMIENQLKVPGLNEKDLNFIRENMSNINNDFISKNSELISMIPDVQILLKDQIITVLNGYGINAPQLYPHFHVKSIFGDHWNHLIKDDEYLRKTDLKNINIIEATKERGLNPNLSEVELQYQLKEWLILSENSLHTLSRISLASLLICRKPLTLNANIPEIKTIMVEQ